MDVQTLTFVLFAALLVLVFLGVPLAFALGAVAIVVGYFQWGPTSLFLMSNQVIGAIFNYTLISIPFFMFMANVLAKAGIAEDLYDAMYVWMGGLRGGLAMGTVVACAIIAAMTGVSAVGVMAMGTLALPSMLNRGYDRSIALGTILAGGALGQLIPPSIIGIVYSGLAGISVGQVFLAGVVPGLILVLLFNVYVGVRCYFEPTLGPPLPQEERERITMREKLVALGRVIPALLLVVAVLGSLFTGIASPTESAAVGAGGSLFLAALHRRLDLKLLWSACNTTVIATTMVMWIALNSLLFVAVYAGIGGDQFVRSMLFGLETGPAAVIAIMMLVMFFLGMVMDPIGILFLTGPIFIPIVEELGYSSLWFAGVVILNLEMAYLTPPFGYNLFYLKSVAPPEITMQHMYRAVPPFVALQALGLLIAILFPEVVTWLPTTVLG